MRLWIGISVGGGFCGAVVSWVGGGVYVCIYLYMHIIRSYLCVYMSMCIYLYTDYFGIFS